MESNYLQLFMRALIGVFVALSLTLAPLQASSAASSVGTATTMAGMKMTDCKTQPCACEKTKSDCDMKLDCAVGCVGFNLSQQSSTPEQVALLREMSFVRLTETLASIETVPLRRPPRV